MVTREKTAMMYNPNIHHRIVGATPCGRPATFADTDAWGDHTEGDHAGSPLQNVGLCGETGGHIVGATPCGRPATFADTDAWGDHTEGDHTGSPLQNVGLCGETGGHAGKNSNGI